MKESEEWGRGWGGGGGGEGVCVCGRGQPISALHFHDPTVLKTFKKNVSEDVQMEDGR